MQEYRNYILNNINQMPNPREDIVRFSTLHSWYKHLGDFSVAYPLLLRGEEPRYNFNPSFNDENQKNFHWRFVLEENISSYFYNVNDSEMKIIPNEVAILMKKFPIYLNRDFGSNNQVNDFQMEICNRMAILFWQELQK